MNTKNRTDEMATIIQSNSKNELNSEDVEKNFYENIVDTVHEPLLILDKDLRVVKASRSFLDFFKVSADVTIGKLIYDLGNREWDIPKLRELLETILPEKISFDKYEVKHYFKIIGQRTMLLNARQIHRAYGKEKIILLAIEDITNRKKAEESLAEKNRLNSEYLDILLEHAHTPIIIWDSSLHINRFNHEFEKLSGYDSSEVIGKPIEILFPKDNIDLMFGLVKNNLNKENSEAIEIDILTKEKIIKTVLWNSTNIFDEKDKNIVATIAQDITYRKQAENKLGILETRYRRLFESAKDGILILDAETGKIIDVNPFLCDLLEYSKEKFVDKELWQIGFFKDIAANKEKFLELQQKEYVRYEDLPLETATGRMINVEFVSNVYIVNQRKVIQCNIRDITERKLAEELLQESKERYRTFFENSMDGILLTSPNGKTISANRAACKMFGYTENELINLGRSGVVDTTDPQLSFLLEERAAKGKVRCELTFIRKDGTHFPGEISSAIFKNRKGKEYTSMIIRDISERKQIQQKIKESEEKFRIITENSADAIFITDNQGRYHYVNTKAVQMLGYSKEEMMRFTIADISPKNKVDEYFQLFKRLLKDGFALAEIDLVKKDGNLIPTDFNAVLLPNGFIFASCRDISERVEIQKKIKFQAELLFNVGQAVIATDLLGRVIYWNHAAENIYGWTIGEAMGKNIIDLTPAEQTKKQATEVMKQLTAGNSWSGEFLVKRKDGSSFTSYVTDAPINDSDGKLIGVIGISSDITERKLSEELLLKLSQVVEQSPVSIIITDTDGTIEFVNQKLIESTGYQQSEIIGMNPRMFASGEKPKSEYKKLWDTIISKKEWRGEFQNKKKNGDLFWELALISPIINKNGDVTHFVATKEDITEKKRAEDKIMLLAHALKSINECVSITDIEDKIIFVNESFLKTYGYNEKELLGKGMNLVRSAKNSPDLTTEILPSTIQGNWHGELWNKRKDGSEFQIYLSTTSIYDKENKLLGLIGVAKDVTENKMIQQELIKAKEKAEQSDKLKSEFLAQMSHEIRTPINVVLGYTEFLNDLFSDRKNSDAEDCFDGINLASKRIIRTIDLILNAAELQTGNYQPHFVTIDLDIGILNKLYHELQLTAKQRGLELIYNCELNETKIFADDYSTTQIFVNLIDNAIKYTKEGKVEILLTKNVTDNITVEIKDTGIGIAEEFLSKLFDAFAQEEQGYSRSFEGNGLGLAIVKSYCDVNNARIEVESVKNVGSIFRVIFDKKSIVNTN